MRFKMFLKMGFSMRSRSIGLEMVHPPGLGIGHATNPAPDGRVCYKASAKRAGSGDYGNLNILIKVIELCEK